MGTIGAVVGKDDVIVIDKLVHASIVDGARLSGAKMRVFAHNDLDELADILKWADQRAPGDGMRRPRTLIVTESVFSMDGDRAPLRNLVVLKEKHGAWLMVDEAHATGLFGAGRRGLAEETGVSDRIEIQMGTLGKALGAAGGYICGPRVLTDYLVNRARSFIFSTAPVPAAAAAARAGVELVQSAEGKSRAEHLWLLIKELRAGLAARGWALPAEACAIIPLIIGGEAEAMAAAAALRDNGVFVSAVRFPTVARGVARIRLTLASLHTSAHLATLLRLPPPGAGSNMNKFARLDHKFVWHPFTQMRDWLKSEPIVIVSGRGAVLRDVRGREYLDANSSIWTNLHGHNDPKINAAIKRQLGKIAHSSALGFANEPASMLAARLVRAAEFVRRGVGGERNQGHPIPRSAASAELKNPRLTKVFFSDDGSTAMEVALKLAYVFARRSRPPSQSRRGGRSAEPRFLSLAGAYHGDTVGAVGLGHIDLFHKTYSGLLFKSDSVMAPYCYRCPFNRARPERADAREYRRCGHECVGMVERKFAAAKKAGNPYAAFVVEPLMQGAAGMIPQPAGWLRRVAEIARGHGAQIVTDEVMAGFGRTGGESLFASHQEGVQPDLLAVAKGLTGGYLPMAATFTTQAVFDAFLGDYAEFKTFFHGHSFTSNQLGASAAHASLDILRERGLQATTAGVGKGVARSVADLVGLAAGGGCPAGGPGGRRGVGAELADARAV